MLEGRNPLENLGKWVFIISALGWFIKETMHGGDALAGAGPSLRRRLRLAPNTHDVSQPGAKPISGSPT